ncbi:hypothetical protein FQR65_LT19653 [Abscondita terminalis]|nr:hypothetical protein FQR65_LT19653 [Abscondita terminalis]
MLFIREKEVQFLGDSLLRRLLTDVLQHNTNQMRTIENRSRRSQELTIGGLASVVFLCIGANNVLRNHSFFTMRNHFEMLMGTIKPMQHVTNIVLITIPSFPSATITQLLIVTKFNRYLKRLENRRITVVDIEWDFEEAFF